MKNPESTDDTSFIPLILGTAGHIDHGKTSLIRALTGTNTDRLPEEKRRGITIQLGFAKLDLGKYRLGIVDVPGHEKFVRTMLSGATGIDLALLVVAADDSINRQTREHLEILNFLKVPAGVIAVTKCDRVESDWLAMVEEEIRGVIQGTVLEGCAIVRTSTVTGIGLEELKNELVVAASKAAVARQSTLAQPFRMAIDRVFSVEGQGTVVTGSVTHGQIQAGQEVNILPQGLWDVRVRQIQTHDQAATSARRGQRAALNLAAVRTEQLHRGDLVVAPGSLVSTKCLTVRIQWNPQFATKFRNHQLVRMHLGTSDVTGQVRWLSPNLKSIASSASEVEPNEASPDDRPISGLAQIWLRESVAAGWQQAIVLRQVSPVRTIGKAEVISSTLPRQHRFAEEELRMLELLSSKSMCERIQASIFFDRSGRITDDEVQQIAQVSLEELRTCLQAWKTRDFQVGNTVLRFHPRRLDQFASQILKKLEQMHDADEKRWLFPIEQLATKVPYMERVVLNSLVQELGRDGTLRVQPRGIGLSDRGPELTKNQQKRLEWLLELFAEAQWNPPSEKQCIELAEKNKQDIPALLRLAIDSGELIDISGAYLLAAEVEQQAWATISSSLQPDQGISVAEIRDALGINRKLTVPLCEHWDREGKLRRVGDLRFLN